MFILNKIGESWINYHYGKRISNSDFSIICSNCIGGVLYHYAGRKFLSPTINLWIRQDDFIKMICDLKYYMKQDIVELKREKLVDYNMDACVYVGGGIQLVC